MSEMAVDVIVVDCDTVHMRVTHGGVTVFICLHPDIMKSLADAMLEARRQALGKLKLVRHDEPKPAS